MIFKKKVCFYYINNLKYKKVKKKRIMKNNYLLIISLKNKN